MRASCAVFERGAPGDALYIVIHGRLEVVTVEGGKESVLADIKPKESIGEMDVLTGEPRSATVRAIRDSLVVRLSRERFEELVVRHPRALLAITHLVIERLRKTSAAQARVPVSQVFAVVPASKNAPLSRFTEALRGLLTPHGSVLVVDAKAADRAGSLTAWLNEQEERHGFLILEADRMATLGRRRPAQQSAGGPRERDQPVHHHRRQSGAGARSNVARRLRAEPSDVDPLQSHQSLERPPAAADRRRAHAQRVPRLLARHRGDLSAYRRMVRSLGDRQRGRRRRLRPGEQRAKAEAALARVTCPHVVEGVIDRRDERCGLHDAPVLVSASGEERHAELGEPRDRVGGDREGVGERGHGADRQRSVGRQEQHGVRRVRVQVAREKPQLLAEGIAIEPGPMLAHQREDMAFVRAHRRQTDRARDLRGRRPADQRAQVCRPLVARTSSRLSGDRFKPKHG
jgi:CRP-like cAMP-binding protein